MSTTSTNSREKRQMGYELRRQLREALGSDITGLQRAVALEIADDANERTRLSVASLEDLVRWTGAKDASVVRNALKRLAAAGWEFRIPIGRGKDGRTLFAVPGTRMTFRVPPFPGAAAASPKGEQGLPLGRAGATPSASQGGAGAHSEGATAHSEGAVAPPYSSDSSDSKELASQPEPSAAVADHGIPAAARPLVDAVTAAGVTVRWPFKGNSWFPILAMITKSGVPAMVDHAMKAAARADVESANYFLRGWRELPPLPEPGADRPLLRSVPTARSTTDQRVAQGQALAAMFREQEQRAIEPRREDQEPA
jgi:hypothetical protein